MENVLLTKICRMALCFHHPIETAGTVSPDVPGSEYITGLSWEIWQKFCRLVGPGEWIRIIWEQKKTQAVQLINVNIDLSGYRYAYISMNYRYVSIYIYRYI